MTNDKPKRSKYGPDLIECLESCRGSFCRFCQGNPSECTCFKRKEPAQQAQPVLGFEWNCDCPNRKTGGHLSDCSIVTGKPKPEPEAQASDLDDANEIIEAYSKSGTLIDEGNLFFAATEYKKAFEAMRAQLSKLRMDAINNNISFSQITKLEVDYLHAELTQAKAELAEARAENEKLHEAIVGKMQEIERLKNGKV